MSRIDLSRIEEIFHAALEIPAAEREGYLEHACGGDAALRSEVESLLELDGRQNELLDGSPAALAAELIGERTDGESKIGSLIGRYSIVRLLGVGGMGEVYLAEDSRLGRKVAIKILPAEFAFDDGRLKRFELEARSASALNHPNILTIHEIGEADGMRFIATEYVDGRTLKDVLRDGKLPVESALEIAVQIGSALDEAHTAGIVHRDIKPDNVMVRPSGLVKILDFGVAKFLETGSGEPTGTAEGPTGRGKTEAGAIIGTADYMSPEQASGGEVDRRSDIFSFGAVLYEMVSGQRAFKGTDAQETMSAIIQKDPEPIRMSVADISDRVEAIITRALAKDPNDRYQTVGDLLADLRNEKRRIEQAEAAVATDESRHLQPEPNGLEELTTERETSSLINHSRPVTRMAMAGSLVAFLAVVGGIFGYRYQAANKEISSIAVMPIANASGNSNIEYLADGMTDNLIRSLSSVPGLSVKARSTVFSYKGKELSPRVIGSDLSVDAVLLGRLEQGDEEIRLSLELVDTSTQDVLWSANYSRVMAELTTMQREIARDVSGHLRPGLTPAEQRRISKNYSTSAEAQLLYLRGRFQWVRRTARDLEKAARFFEQAIEKDPDYALAYTGLADAYALKPLYGNFSPHEHLPKAKQAALKALEIDPNLAEAHASLGYIAQTFEHDWETAGNEYRTAIRLNPNYATARQWYAEHLAFRGNLEEALVEIDVALELDPFSMVINRMKGNLLTFSKRYDEAIAQFERTIELYPESPIVRFNLAEAHAAKGKRAEAIEHFLAGLQLDGASNYELRRYKSAFKLKGWNGFWMEHLATMINLERAVKGNKDRSFYDNEGLAYAYAAVNYNEKAIEYLNKAYEAREPSIVTIANSDVYDGLRSDVRFQELIAKIGLPQ